MTQDVMQLTRQALKKLRTSLGRKPFLNPYSDQSAPQLWREEIETVRRMAAGDRLVSSRFYYQEEDCYAMYWYWEVYPGFDREKKGERDSPAMLLMSRGVIRRVRCAGGADHMIFTPAAEHAISVAQNGGAA